MLQKESLLTNLNLENHTFSLEYVPVSTTDQYYPSCMTVNHSNESENENMPGVLVMQHHLAVTNRHEKIYSCNKKQHQFQMLRSVNKEPTSEMVSLQQH
jgi:hypothetical protein